MRAIALLAVFNEERFIAACLDHLIGRGLQVYLIDNGSTDGTLAVADRYVGRGLLAIETAPRHGVYAWRPLLERKEELAATLDAEAAPDVNCVVSLPSPSNVLSSTPPAV